METEYEPKWNGKIDFAALRKNAGYQNWFQREMINEYVPPSLRARDKEAETWCCAQCGNDTSVPVRRDEFPCQGSIIQETAFCSSECYELWLKKQIPQTDLGGDGD